MWLTNKKEVTEGYDHDHDKKLQPYVRVNAVYPESAREAQLQGVVTVSFLTHNDCSVSNINIVKSLSPDCDKSAIDAIIKMSDILKQYGVDCEEEEVTQEINFQLL